MGGQARYQAFFPAVIAACAFAGAAVFLSLWLFLAEFLPAGASPAGALASLTVDEPSRRPGVPTRLLELAPTLRGVGAAYGARPAAFSVEHKDARAELVGAFVSRDFFAALGVALDGSGFSFQQPWQRNVPKECVLSSAGAEKLFGAADALGQEIQVNGRACQVVAVVKGAFSGLRPPRREDVWLSWPSMIGLGVPEMAPEDFLEETFPAREAGLLLSGERSLAELEQDLRALYAEQVSGTGQLRLLAGEGLDPAERERVKAEMNLLFAATATLLLVVGCVLVAASVWRAERQRGELATRLALGATRERLAVAALWRALRFFALSLLAGVLLAVLSYRALIGLLDLGPLAGLLPAWPSLQAFVFAAAVLLAIAVLGGLAEVRVVLASKEGALWRQIQASRRSNWVEASAISLVVAVVAFALLLSLGLAAEQQRLAAVDLGYAHADTVVHSFERPTTIAQAQLYAAPQVEPSAFLADLEARFGVGKVALASSVPYRPVPVSWPVLPPAGEADRGPLQFQFNTVTPGFFSLIGARFLEGGVFEEGSDELVLGEAAARRLLGSPPWAGRSVRLQGAMGDSEHRVSGVVADLHMQGRGEAPEAYIYRPLSSLSNAFHVLVRRSPLEAESGLVASIAQVHGLRAPLRPPLSLAAEQAQHERLPRFRAWLVLGACALSVLLGALGLAATLATAMRRRLHELALRSALGASASRLLLLIGQRLAVLLPIGLVLGGLGFVAIGRSALTGAHSMAQLPALSGLWAMLALALVAAAAALPVLFKLYRLAPARLLASE
jgi:putative ABC transport system permease protein